MVKGRVPDIVLKLHQYAYQNDVNRQLGPLDSLHILNFDLVFDFLGQIQGQGMGTGYCPKITSARIPKWSRTQFGFPRQLTQPWTLTWHLTFKVKCKVKGRVLDIVPKVQQHAFQNGPELWLASLDSLHTHPWTLTLDLTFNVKFQAKWRGTGYRPEIMSACIPKCSQTIASLPGQHA